MSPEWVRVGAGHTLRLSVTQARRRELAGDPTPDGCSYARRASGDSTQLGDSGLAAPRFRHRVTLGVDRGGGSVEGCHWQDLNVPPLGYERLVIAVLSA
jgi:hypothetical protein